MTALGGQLALVTGASRGIGAATAAALAAAGATVVRVARTLRERVTGSIHDFPCDLADPAEVERLARSVLSAIGTPHILVNNAGVFDRLPFELSQVAEFERQVRINLIAPFAVARGFLPAMREAGRGLLITIGSVADHVPFPENTVYSATKYGLRGLHETLRAEYMGTGVRCTLVSPGPTDTPIWDTVTAESRAKVRPRDSMLRPEDVAEAILFVATRPARVHVDWLRFGPAARA